MMVQPEDRWQLDIGHSNLQNWESTNSTHHKLPSPGYFVGMAQKYQKVSLCFIKLDFIYLSI
jgi:hypothetical protein